MELRFCQPNQNGFINSSLISPQFKADIKKTQFWYGKLTVVRELVRSVSGLKFMGRKTTWF